MALRLKSNPAPISGALFVSNPRKRKVVRKKRAVKKLRVIRKRKNTAKKRKNPVRKKRLVLRKKVRKNSARKRKNPIRKRRVVARKKRKNPIRRRRVVARKKRKNPIRKRRAVSRKRRANPRKRKSVTRIIRKNPMVLGFLNPIQKLVSKVPLIGKKIAPYTQPAIIAMIGGAGVVGGMSMVGKIPVVGEYAKYPLGHAFGATVMGIGLAVVSAFLPVKPATKKALALAFAGAGGAINAGQLMMSGFDLQEVADQNKALLGDTSEMSENELIVDEVMIAEQEAVAGLGDGGYYEIEPLSGVAYDMAGIDYDSAQYGDAYSAPPDLSVLEGQMAVRGREAFMNRFSAPPKRMAGEKRASSSMAGKMGHRWGWLIKSLGWYRFSQLAKMPPAQRRKLIRTMKSSAMQASKSTFDRELTGAYQGISYSGIEYNTMDMSGLAIDNMAGIAIVGAGI